VTIVIVLVVVDDFDRLAASGLYNAVVIGVRSYASSSDNHPVHGRA